MSIKTAKCALFLSLTLSSATYAATWSGNGHEYLVIPAQDITWTDSRAAAQALGAGWDLASIGSAEENDFVKSLLNSGLTNRAHFWIGATDAAVEGTWVWVDDTPWGFTNWWLGEPNNPGEEDYLAYDLRDGSWAWNDAPNDLATTFPGFPQGYVAELSPSAPPAITAIPALSQWGIIILSGLLALGTIIILRHQRS